MGIVDALLLGVTQGLTEFIPVSSSGHLVLLHKVLGAEQSGLGFDVALHIGTLFALVLFFYRDILDLCKRLMSGGKQARLPLLLGVACVPAVATGVLLQGLAEDTFRSPRLVAVNLAVFGLIMLVAEKYAAKRSRTKDLEKISLRQVGLIGVMQALAIVPGVSRSGSTITGGLFGGLDRVAAARFSFLLAIPITLGAVLKLALDGSFAELSSELTVVIVGGLVALLSGLFAIRFLLKFVANHSLASFAYYRLALAAVVLLLA